MIKLVASLNRKCELGNQTYTKRCAVCSRTQHPSLMRLTSRTIELFLKNLCVGILEFVYRSIVLQKTISRRATLHGSDPKIGSVKARYHTLTDNTDCTMVFQNKLSKWPEVYAIPDRKAETVAKCLQYLVWKHVVPTRIICDWI